MELGKSVITQMQWRDGKGSKADRYRNGYDMDQSDIEELRAAYQAAVSNQPAALDFSAFEPDEAGNGNHRVVVMMEDWLVRFLNRPRLVVSSAVGVCVLASAVYGVLGYWWLASDARAVQSTDAVAMLNVDETSHLRQDTASTLANIERLQQNMSVSADEADGLPADMAGENFALLTINTMDKELIGRADPFSPLVKPNGELTSGVAEQEKDVLQNVQFTGFVGDMNAKDKVAIIRIQDPLTGAQTWIKKPGDTFEVDGETVQLKSIGKDSLLLRVKGQNRRLSLQSHVEITSASTAAASGNAASTGSADAPPAVEGEPRLAE